MTESSSQFTSLRRRLALFVIASSLSVLCGIVVASLVFRVGGLERERPFSALYEGKRVGTLWRPVSQYMLCASVQWLMEVQSRTVEAEVRRLWGGGFQELMDEANRLDQEAARLEEAGRAAEAAQVRLDAQQKRAEARKMEREAKQLSGPRGLKRQRLERTLAALVDQVNQLKEQAAQLQQEGKLAEAQQLSLQASAAKNQADVTQLRLRPRNYIARYYNLILIPILALSISVWLVAMYVPREVRGTNEIVKIGAVVGVFHGIVLGLLVVLWWLLGGDSLRDFYVNGNFYHGQWTGRWLYPVAGVILTGYLFGTLAGWLVKGVERLRIGLIGGIKQPSQRAT